MILDSGLLFLGHPVGLDTDIAFSICALKKM